MKPTPMCGVYQIRNTVNGKVYIGSSKNIERRFVDHKLALRKGAHHSVTLQRAWKKYGGDVFEFSVIALVTDPALLKNVEQAYIDFFGCIGRKGYNVSPMAQSPLGVKHTLETREKLRAAKLGVKQSRELVERRIQPLVGRQLSTDLVERRVRTRKANGSYRQTPESLAKMVEKRRARGNYAHSPEARARISAATKAGIAKRKAAQQGTPT